LLIFKDVFVIFYIKYNISPILNQKLLKVAENVYIHVLEYPTKFQAEIIKKVMVISK